jgi:DNA-directed RNA polymerase omega subunit
LINTEDLLTKAKNKFLLVNAAAGRAKQILEGSLPYVDNFDPNNPIITALREIAADKMRIKVMSGPGKKPQEILAFEDIQRPSALQRLARDKRGKKEKKKK